MLLYKIEYRDFDGSTSTILKVGDDEDDAVRRFYTVPFSSGIKIYDINAVAEVDGHKIIVQ